MTEGNHRAVLIIAVFTHDIVRQAQYFLYFWSLPLLECPFPGVGE